MKYIHSLYIGLLSLLFIGCQEEQLNNMQTGGFLISLNDDVSTEVTTKSTPAELGEPATENFKLKIVNETTNNLLYDGAYKSGTIPASAGTYTVTAMFGDNSLVALDEPYYKGEQTGVVVEEGKTTSVQLACKVANALASVIFPDATEMAKIYESYWVKVAVENYSVKLKPNSTNSAYFQVGKEVSFYFEGEKLNGQSVSAKLEHEDLPTTFEAADHYTLTLTFNDDLSLDISKVEAGTVTINETIPMEWLPKPKVEAEGFIDNTLTFVETETPEASIKLSTVSALQDLKLKFNFQDEQFQSSLQIDKEYLLSNKDDRQAIETALGITLPEIGTTDASFDLSPLLAKLQTNAGEATANTIEIDVKANNRWSSEVIDGQETPNLKYTLICEKPEFTVSAYPGNIWTKEFTMNALMEDQVKKGDFSKLSANMKYQFSPNGESDWTVFGKDLRKDGLTPGTTYYIRGVYRGEVCSDPVAVSTYPIIELENGDMEDWQYTDGPEASWPSKGPFWKRWYVRDTKDESVDGWCSLNYYTTSNNDPKAYCSNSGTERSEVKHGGNYAAEIKTIGWGDGTTAASPISTIKNNTPGELFLGRINNNEREYGISYVSRPTNLVFWYKYVPEGSHEFSAKIVIENKNENLILAEEEFFGVEQNSYVEKNISIEYKDEYIDIEPTHIYILFCSGENSNSEVDKASISRGSRHVGNILYIDDISLVYDK